MLEKVVCVDFLGWIACNCLEKKNESSEKSCAAFVLFHFSTTVLIFLSSSSLSPLCLPFLRLLSVVFSFGKLSVTSISQFPSLPSNNICSPALLPVWFGSPSVTLSPSCSVCFPLTIDVSYWLVVKTFTTVGTFFREVKLFFSKHTSWKFKEVFWQVSSRGNIVESACVIITRRVWREY